jgi:flavorubredoxin
MNRLVLPLAGLPLAQITQVAAGTKMTIGSRSLEFVDALLKDQPGSQWIYDGRTQTLFSGDGFGYRRLPQHGNRFSDEIPDGIQPGQFERYHRATFRFLRWIKPDRFNGDLDRLFQGRPIAIIAPIHGLAIRGDIDLHLFRLKSAITAICQSYQKEPG